MGEVVVGIIVIVMCYIMSWFVPHLATFDAQQNSGNLYNVGDGGLLFAESSI